MMFHTDDEIEKIGKGLLDRTLPKADWTHAAHFAAAVWMLRRRGQAAFSEMPGIIRAYNEATGGRNTDAEGYHETITRASLIVARAHLAAQADRPMFKQVNSLLGGPCGQSGWILLHWSPERLFSAEARRAWVDPDLAPLPA
ncbi:hypothetical protein [Hyphomonas sp.]|uniref:hypothetical protein n=1 Tax=Hyphomonas sp. TaxID=87 RepID=UPI00391AD046